MTLVVNLFAGPGTGKSTTAAGLFYKMKTAGYKCELVTEYVKDVVWERRTTLFDNQLYLVAKQHQRLVRLMSHELDFIVTDSPLLQMVAYSDEADRPLKDLIEHRFLDFKNHNIFLERVKAYMPYGRGQTEDQARALDANIKALLLTHDKNPLLLPADECAPEVIFKQLTQQRT